MKLMPQIYKIMNPFFKEHGFTKKRGTYFKFSNNIAFCISFQKPSDLVYVPFCLVPLYRPSTNLYLTYGDRIGNRYPDRLPQLTGEANEESIITWCKLLQTILIDEIFPFFEEVATPEKLLNYIERDPGKALKYLFCGPYHFAVLYMYTSLYLHKYDTFSEAASLCRQVLENYPFTAEGKKCEYEEIAQLEQLSTCGDDSVDAFFQQTILNTIAVCF